MQSTPIPSTPPSPDLPLTTTLTNPDSRKIRCANRSNASGAIFWRIANLPTRSRRVLVQLFGGRLL
jgi:hypothetical protein